MQRCINPLGQRCVDPFHARDFLRARCFQASQSAEMLQQAGAPAWPDTGYVFEPARAARFLSATAMAGDGKPVRFIAYLLDELQAA